MSGQNCSSAQPGKLHSHLRVTRQRTSALASRLQVCSYKARPWLTSPNLSATVFHLLYFASIHLLEPGQRGAGLIYSAPGFIHSHTQCTRFHTQRTRFHTQFWCRFLTQCTRFHRQSYTVHQVSYTVYSDKERPVFPHWRIILQGLQKKAFSQQVRLLALYNISYIKIPPFSQPSSPGHTVFSKYLQQTNASKCNPSFQHFSLHKKVRPSRPLEPSCPVLVQ